MRDCVKGWQHSLTQAGPLFLWSAGSVEHTSQHCVSGKGRLLSGPVLFCHLLTASVPSGVWEKEKRFQYKDTLCSR